MPSEAPRAQIHATAVAMGPPGARRGILLTGPSGAGKSDLALRLMDRGARLVADDRVDLRLDDGCVVASAPPALAGKMEVRGLGILSRNYEKAAPVRLAVALVPRAEVPRVPEPETVTLLGRAIPQLRLHAFDASAPVKVAWALARL